jgi:hypothetical protein
MSAPFKGDLPYDINFMHQKYGVHKWIAENKDNKELMKKFLKFRLSFLMEELQETEKAVDEKDSEEVVDGLIDLVVVALGTLDAFGVDTYRAWDEVLRANLDKEVGVKESRPNPLGMPDLIKPEGWEAPTHRGNHGIIPNAFQ